MIRLVVFVAAVTLAYVPARAQPVPTSLDYYQARVGECDLRAAQMQAEIVALKAQLAKAAAEKTGP